MNWQLSAMLCSLHDSPHPEAQTQPHLAYALAVLKEGLFN